MGPLAPADEGKGLSGPSCQHLVRREERVVRHRLAPTTVYDGIDVLDGSMNSLLTIQSGANFVCRGKDTLAET